MIVLDTHAWIWWASDPSQLSPAASASLAHATDQGGPVYVSSISVWELAVLVQRGRLELSLDVEDWIAHSESVPAIEFVPVSNHLALRSVNLPGVLHGDPADRIIVATARYLGMPLITRDHKLREYEHVETVW